jgi:4'-phosphopantetheinyl transferase
MGLPGSHLMHTIDLWLAFYDEVNDEHLLAQLRGLLSDAERQQAQRYHFADDRKRHLITRALVRTVLSRYEAVAPADWVFTTNRYGRPEIGSCGAEGCDLCFNISHTRGLIALGVTRGGALGIDVENASARAASIGIAQRYFAPTEAAELCQVPPERQQDRFFEYWTFKESYIKARGMGLALGLDQFSFNFPHARGVCFETADDVGGRWRFWQFRPGPEYLLAVCAERVGPQAPRIAIRRIFSSVTDEKLDLSAVRASE